MGSNQGKPELDTHDENCTAGRYKVGKGRRRAFICFWKDASSDFTGNTIVKIERGHVGT